MSSRNTKILIIIAVSVTTIFIFQFFYDEKKEQKMIGNLENLPAIFKEEKNKKSDSVSSTPPASSQSVQTQKYENIKYGFSFNYPSDFKASEFAEEDGKTVLTVQNAKTGEGLQIYITAYDDPSFVVSRERILSDVPDMPFLNSADVVVGGKAKGVAFFSQNESFGETAEAWFAHESKFFQATTYRKDVGLLEEIIKSWEFSN